MTSTLSEATLTITAGDETVTAVERFEFGEPDNSPPPDSSAPALPSNETTHSPEQRAATTAISAAVEDRWLRSEAFIAAMVLRSRARNRLTVYSQWRNPAAAAPIDVPKDWSLSDPVAQAVPSARILSAHTYSVEFTDGSTQPTVISRSATPLVHFGMFAVEPANQDKLLDLAKNDAPASLATPGLVAINFHRSLDGGQALNVGSWSTFEEFFVLLDQPGFADHAVYWEGVAEFAPDYFDVVEVIA